MNGPEMQHCCRSDYWEWLKWKVVIIQGTFRSANTSSGMNTEKIERTSMLFSTWVRTAR